MPWAGLVAHRLRASGCRLFFASETVREIMHLNSQGAGDHGDALFSGGTRTHPGVVVLRKPAPILGQY